MLGQQKYSARKKTQTSKKVYKNKNLTTTSIKVRKKSIGRHNLT